MHDTFADDKWRNLKLHDLANFEKFYYQKQTTFH